MIASGLRYGVGYLSNAYAFSIASCQQILDNEKNMKTQDIKIPIPVSQLPGSITSPPDASEISQPIPRETSVPKPDTETSTPAQSGFWRVFISTFGAIFLAEFGDKTQLATLLMSAESGNPWVVFLGAGTALVMTSLIGVLLGQWLARKVSPHTLDTAAGSVLLIITVWLLWDVVNV